LVSLRPTGRHNNNAGRGIHTAGRVPENVCVLRRLGLVDRRQERRRPASRRPAAVWQPQIRDRNRRPLRTVTPGPSTAVFVRHVVRCPFVRQSQGTFSLITRLAGWHLFGNRFKDKRAASLRTFPPERIAH